VFGAEPWRHLTKVNAVIWLALASVAVTKNDQESLENASSLSERLTDPVDWFTVNGRGAPGMEYIVVPDVVPLTSAATVTRSSPTTYKFRKNIRALTYLKN